MSSHTLEAGLKTTLTETTFLTSDDPVERYDVVIRFLSAENIPKNDTLSESDAYFIARIDEHVTYKSSVIRDTASPKWEDEKWIVRNIPRTANLLVVVFDKDVVGNADDYIGQFEIPDIINYNASSDGHEIVTPRGEKHGRFHLTIESTESSEESKQLPKYTFDGPCRYFRNDLASAGLIAKINDTDKHSYSTWAITMKRVSLYFPPSESQHWDQKYKAARKIFGPNPLTVIWRDTIKLAHKALYGKTLHYTESGRLNNADDLWKLIFSDKNGQKLKPCVYTYAIDDGAWRFSETRDEGFTHFISKHAVMANGLEYVRYAGEFYPRPKNGWDKPDGEWELVIDNGSGTYAPTPDNLGKLKELLLCNFPDLDVVTYTYEDPTNKENKKQLQSLYGQ